MRRVGLVACWEDAALAAPTLVRTLTVDGGAQPRIVSSRDGSAAVGASGSRGADVLGKESNDLLIAFEGRIDEIATLQAAWGLGPEASDARTIVEGYLRNGDEWIKKLRGDYSFVIWDGHRKRVLAARDPFGVRPLHYASFGGKLCIASEVDQILAGGLRDAVPDDESVVDFLTRRSRTLEKSFFRDIARIPAGHLLIATRAQIRTWDYRDVPVARLTFSTKAECYEGFRDRFLSSVRRRLTTEAPVVIQLSGGVDSTSIVCAADALSKRNVGGIGSAVAASAIYPGLACDEAAYIDSVEKHTAIPVFRWDGTLSDGREFSEPLVAAPGARMPWAGGTDGHVAIARRQGATSILDGTGGDQIGMPLGAEADELSRRDWWRLTRDVLTSDTALSGERPLVLRWAAGLLVPLRVRRLYHCMRRRWRSEEPPYWLLRIPAHDRNMKDAPFRHRSFLSRSQRMRWTTLVGAQLASAIDGKQRHASSQRLEMVFPFLDWDLVQFTLAIPQEYWPEPAWMARLHREALRPDLPSAVYLRRSKAEFAPAMVNRVRRSLGAISDLLGGQTWQAGRYLRQTDARKMLEEFRTAPAPSFAAAYHLWAIASLEAWLRRLLSYRTPSGGA